MIIIAGRVPIKPGTQAEALKVAQVMADASQAEDGCLQYRFYIDPTDPDSLFIFERWETEAALQAHFQTPHMAEFRQHIPRFVAGEMEIFRYDVSAVERA